MVFVYLGFNYLFVVVLKKIEAPYDFLTWEDYWTFVFIIVTIASSIFCHGLIALFTQVLHGRYESDYLMFGSSSTSE